MENQKTLKNILKNYANYGIKHENKIISFDKQISDIIDTVTEKDISDVLVNISQDTDIIFKTKATMINNLNVIYNAVLGRKGMNAIKPVEAVKPVKPAKPVGSSK